MSCVGGSDWRGSAGIISGGDRIRTCDLEVMSLASYRAAPPRVLGEKWAQPPRFAGPLFFFRCNVYELS